VVPDTAGLPLEGTFQLNRFSWRRAKRHQAPNRPGRLSTGSELDL